MLACFATQERVLKQFGVDVDEELIRRVPVYDFTQPPHDGPLSTSTSTGVSTAGRDPRSPAMRSGICPLRERGR